MVTTTDSMATDSMATDSMGITAMAVINRTTDISSTDDHRMATALMVDTVMVRW